jgi:hypothetical protein
MNGVKRNAYRILVGKPEGKRPLGKPKVGGLVILKSIFDRMGWYGLIWFIIGNGEGLL